MDKFLSTAMSRQKLKTLSRDFTHAMRKFTSRSQLNANKCLDVDIDPVYPYSMTFPPVTNEPHLVLIIPVAILMVIGERLGLEASMFQDGGRRRNPRETV